ncbi:hypothetical protein [Antribacter gilvus]|uniref:hypothetical protein n=1 Tax=Antribacter gilvus TaxID=2304675 RepID=UPI00198244C9
MLDALGNLDIFRAKHGFGRSGGGYRCGHGARRQVESFLVRMAGGSAAQVML